MPVTPSASWPWYYTLDDLEAAGLPREHFMLDYFYEPGESVLSLTLKQPGNLKKADKPRRVTGTLESYMRTGTFPNAQRGHAAPPYGGPPDSGFPRGWYPPPDTSNQIPNPSQANPGAPPPPRPTPRYIPEESRYTVYPCLSNPTPYCTASHMTSQHYTRQVERVPGAPTRFCVPAEQIAALFPEGVVAQHAGGDLTVRRQFRDSETGGTWTVTGPHPPLDPGTSQDRYQSPSEEQRQDRRRREREEEESRANRFHRQ